jgi:outer membrane protein, heavy metal efflux system
MSQAAGALPDPMVSFGLNGERYPGNLLGEDPMVMGTVMLNQTFPFPGKRDRRRETASAEAELSRAEWQRMKRQMAADVRSMYADLYAMDAMTASLRESQAALNLVESSAVARVSTGLAMQADLLEVQLQRSRVAEQLDDLKVDRVAMAARLNAMLDRPADTPIRTGEPPQFPEPRTVHSDEPTPDDAASPLHDPGTPTVDADARELDSLAVANGPEVELRRRAVIVGQWKLEEAQRESWPDLSAGVEYGWRNGIPPMVTATLGLEIPIWKGRKQDSETRAAAHELEMAREDQRMAESQARGEAARLRSSRDVAARQAERYRLEIVPRSALVLESARSSYVAGTGGGVRAVIAALQMLLDARSGLARRHADLYKAEVALAALAGTDPLVPAEGDSK